ncbi:hypothetical protein LUX12_22240 [Streptomyces somaliensis]|uniref:hypothetical protein n=1 Tax=Streptomyces somaliensis TaxID=78355 RepID=UPI0020CCAEF3|nr:hypothetical protein [Streptomyces somaliensis]MCP9946912.1 hypothetical protein [Streptomyces somaliensis]MCP9976112.1 hypothetical protein [Streptomyces somaliensis]MCP9976183.1 hypothetical protein [Streptomyces somaliensis]
MFQETPIYSRLVEERGDVPQAVRGEAERIQRDLGRLIMLSPQPPAGGHHYHPQPAH